LVEDPAGAWRSPWLRACALRAAQRLGVAGAMNIGAVRAADALLEELLAGG
jgi:hypothetical protein